MEDQRDLLKEIVDTIEEYNRECTSIEETNNWIKDKNKEIIEITDSLYKEISDYKEEIRYLENQNIHLEERNSVLEEKAEELKEEISSLKDQILDLKKNIDGSKGK